MTDFAKYFETDLKAAPLEKLFTYPGTGWRLKIRYMDGTQGDEIRGRHKLMLASEEEGGAPVAQDQFGKQLLMAMVLGWEGLKVRDLPKLARVKPDIKKEDPDKEVPFSHGVLFKLCDTVNRLEQWIGTNATDITNFQTVTFEADLENLGGGPSTSLPGPVEDASRGSSKAEKSGAGGGASE